MEVQSTSMPTSTTGCVELAQAPAEVADPCTMVIFGATGDLAMRKLAPALYNLKGEGLLGEAFAVVGVGRDGLTRERYQQKIDRDLREFGPKPTDVARAEWLLQRASYLAGSFDDDATYRRLREHLAERTDAPANVLFYLATPPSLFEPIIERLASVGLTD